MKTPEETKKMLECCYGNKERRLCEKCPNACKVEGYSELICTDFDTTGENALALIQHLERERDAAANAMKELAARINSGEDVVACEYCKKEFGACSCNCLKEFEWRGLEVE